CKQPANGSTCQPGGAGLASAASVKVAMQNGQTKNVSSIHVPPDYDFGVQADLAILKLSDPVRDIRPTPINDTVSVGFGTPGIIAG
ncbi:MAG: hypothetical protein GWN87_32310, partial [Desulfuromonadales bacterium]|nr:hypothetical protein [Desulfuromonadales bacterium]